MRFDFRRKMTSFTGHQPIRHVLFKRTDADLGKHVLEVHPGHSQNHVKQVLHDMCVAETRRIQE